MEKIYITKSGNILRHSPAGAYLQTPEHEFVRQVPESEYTFLSNVCLPALLPESIPHFTKMPVWRPLWSVTEYDNRKFIPELSSNGGAYGYYTKIVYYAAMVPTACGSRLEIRRTERKGSTADFYQSDEGQFCRPSEVCKYTCGNAEGNPAFDKKITVWDEYGNPVKDLIATLEQHSELSTLEAALAATGCEQLESGCYDFALTFAEKKARLSRLAELGIARERPFTRRFRKTRRA